MENVNDAVRYVAQVKEMIKSFLEMNDIENINLLSASLVLLEQAEESLSKH